MSPTIKDIYGLDVVELRFPTGWEPIELRRMFRKPERGETFLGRISYGSIQSDGNVDGPRIILRKTVKK